MLDIPVYCVKFCADQPFETPCIFFSWEAFVEYFAKLSEYFKEYFQVCREYNMFDSSCYWCKNIMYSFFSISTSILFFFLMPTAMKSSKYEKPGLE